MMAVGCGNNCRRAPYSNALPAHQLVTYHVTKMRGESLSRHNPPRRKTRIAAVMCLVLRANVPPRSKPVRQLTKPSDAFAEADPGTRSIQASLRMRGRAGATKVRPWRIAAQLAIMDADV
jgi:hypothetical protein